MEWARVVNYEDGNYNSQYAADKWFSSYKSITTNSSKSTFYVGGEVVNYYGDSGGGSTLIVKSIDATGNFQIAHKSYVSYGIPSRSDLTYAYFMDIQMEGNTLTMSASARYAAQGKQFIRYTLEPASLSINQK